MTKRETDSKLLSLLKANAREPTASLARKLGLARSTVQERIARLERSGTIAGYTVRLADGQPGLRIDFAAPSPLGLLAGSIPG